MSSRTTHRHVRAPRHRFAFGSWEKITVAAVFAASLGACTKEQSSPATPAASPCTALGLPSSVSLGAGRVQTFPLPGALSQAGLSLSPSGGARAWLDTDAAGATQLVLDAGYGTGPSELVVQCNDGGSSRITVERKAMSWSKLAQWTQGVDGPQGREYFAFWQDQGDANRLFVLSGFQYVPKQYTHSNDLWSFDIQSAKWTSQIYTGELPLVAGSRTASMPGQRGVMFYGGTVNVGSTDGAIDTPPLMKELSYDAQSFSVKSAPLESSAPGSYTGSLVYDEKRSRFLSVCGAGSVRGLHCRVDSYTREAGFKEIQTAADVTSGKKPKGRYGFHFAMDNVNDRVLMFGGQTGPSDNDIGADTWALDLSTTPAQWVQLIESADAATKRRNGAWAHDPEGQRLFVWGGTPNGRTSIDGIQVLSMRKGHEQWESLALPSAPHARTSGMAVYDAQGKRLIMGFGNDNEVYADLWALSLP